MSYDANSIKLLEGLEAVRARPGMYIGGTNEAAWHHCLWEVVDNSVDEHLAGHCDAISITLNEDNSCTVVDNGRGIPTGVYTEGKHKGIPAVQIAMTELHAGGKFDSDSYAISGGLHGVGISVVNAMSKWVTAQIAQNGVVQEIKFATQMVEEYGKHKEKYGAVISPLTIIKKIPKSVTGTTITFQLDPDAFSSREWNRSMIANRVRDLGYLNPKLRINFFDNRNPDDLYKLEVHSPDGLVGLSRDKGEERLDRIAAKRKSKDGEGALPTAVVDPAKPIMLDGMFDDGIQSWSVCIQWYPDSVTESVSFANNIRTIDGGTHVDGAVQPLTRVLNSWAKQDQIAALKKNVSLESVDVRAGLGVIVSVRISDPQFQGQTKGKLISEGIKSVVAQGVSRELTNWLNNNPSEGLKIVQACLKAHKVRSAIEDAAKKAQEEDIIDAIPPAKKVAIESKIIDCIVHDSNRSEIFIVEGDSAADPAVKGRDPEYQAILPIRGVPINTRTANRKKVLDNAEVQMILMALGTGHGSNFDKKKLKFNKVIILTDADYDGKHIETLLLTMFWELVPELLLDGHIHVAKTPLYSATVNDQELFIYSDEEKAEQDRIWATKRKSPIEWRRFKGLGEMDYEDLETAALHPDTRKLIKMHVEDGEADVVEDTIARMMAGDATERKRFVEEIIISDDMMTG